MFDYYDDFITRAVIGSCRRASRYRSRRESYVDSENKSERNPEHNRSLVRMIELPNWTAQDIYVCLLGGSGNDIK